jgi:hypothetical protein
MVGIDWRRVFDRVTSRPGLSLALNSAAVIALLLPLGAVGQENASPPNAVNANVAELAKQVAELRATVKELQSQVRELQSSRAPVASQATAPALLAVNNVQPVFATSRLAPVGLATSGVVQPVAIAETNLGTQPVSQAPAGTPPQPRAEFDFLRGTTVNFAFDGYYAYNFNDPIGRVNLLRAFDVSSNAFSLNQADIVLENAPDVANGKRIGARVDLQFGQATETLQGNSANEPRPDIYRNVFQAYGTYVVPLGSGLTFDFGKWSSSLGMENNYTKDQMNYSRSYWFNFLPYYHMGARLHYQINEKFGLNYWVANGTQQTEPFNGYKDEMFGFVVTPTKNLSWTVNYYLGQEHPDFQFVTNGPPSLPALQGTPFEPIPNPANGKLHIFDSYATWNASNKWTLAAEADYVLERLYSTSLPAHTEGGALYARYQWTPKLAFAARSEYLADYGGLFSGKTQALKEVTATFEYKLAEGFLMREEWRQDWSNQPFFLSPTLGVLKPRQDTATVGLVWWFGGKEGAW